MSNLKAIYKLWALFPGGWKNSNLCEKYQHAKIEKIVFFKSKLKLPSQNWDGTTTMWTVKLSGKKDKGHWSEPCYQDMLYNMRDTMHKAQSTCTPLWVISTECMLASIHLPAERNTGACNVFFVFCNCTNILTRSNTFSATVFPVSCRCCFFFTSSELWTSFAE